MSDNTTPSRPHATTPRCPGAPSKPDSIRVPTSPPASPCPSAMVLDNEFGALGKLFRETAPGISSFYWNTNKSAWVVTDLQGQVTQYPQATEGELLAKPEIREYLRQAHSDHVHSLIGDSTATTNMPTSAFDNIVTDLQPPIMSAAQVPLSRNIINSSSDIAMADFDFNAHDPEEPSSMTLAQLPETPVPLVDPGNSTASSNDIEMSNHGFDTVALPRNPKAFVLGSSSTPSPFLSPTYAHSSTPTQVCSSTPASSSPSPCASTAAALLNGKRPHKTGGRVRNPRTSGSSAPEGRRKVLRQTPLQTSVDGRRVSRSAQQQSQQGGNGNGELRFVVVTKDGCE